jgi:hypothetical protein
MNYERCHSERNKRSEYSRRISAKRKEILRFASLSQDDRLFVILNEVKNLIPFGKDPSTALRMTKGNNEQLTIKKKKVMRIV